MPKSDKVYKNEAKLPINPIVQKYNFDCGLAAIKTFLCTAGKEVEDEVILKYLKTNRVSGTHPRGIIQFVEHCGFEFVERLGATVSEIEEKITEGYYCLVVYQAWGSPKEHKNLLAGHYSLAYGYDSENLHLADPSVYEEDELEMGEGLRKLTKKEFDKDWIDQDYQGNVFDHWMLAIRPSI